ncbi:hypothetical protein [Pseudonocardia humida]|uniref:hypothetical protein n=1 Tax=Pseudonocardia humida TaxID=2800819 RepID=UPI0027E2AE2B|nr:hypothetical protein [Pseudonocardia humida]
MSGERGVRRTSTPRRAWRFATATTPIAAVRTWTSSSSQSMPEVADAIPSARTMNVATKAASTPTSTVSRTGIG